MNDNNNDNDDSGSAQFGVKSVEVACRVVAALAEAHRPLMLSELAKTINMPAAKVHRYLVSLGRAGMVEQHGSGGRYALGSLALTIGLSALNQLDAVKAIGAVAAELRDRTDQTTLVAIWGSAGPTVVRWEECRRPTAVNVRMGSILRLLDSATGLIFSAYLPRHMTQEVMAPELVGREPKDVEALLADVRARRMSRVCGQQVASVNALSAPVFDLNNHLVAAITLLGPEARFDPAWDGMLARELSVAARTTSERLGARLSE